MTTTIRTLLDSGKKSQSTRSAVQTAIDLSKRDGTWLHPTRWEWQCRAARLAKGLK